MASFESVLQIKGKEYNVLYSDFDIHQYTDSLGRPASPTFGGVYTLDIEAPPSGDSTLFDWMVEPGLFLNGQVLIKNLSSRTNLKVIKFYNAYCVDLEQHFDGTGLSGGDARSLRLSLRVSPQAVNINGQMHDNNWPAPEPIVDWDWTEMDAACHPERQVKEEPSALSEGLHTLLDVVGMIPVVGELADGANALLYAAEGDYTNAALSAASMIPLAGNVVGAAKLAKRGVKLAQKAAKLVPPKLLSKLDDGADVVKKVCEKDPVDVATGMMLTQRIDVELPGPIPFVWERTWFSASDHQGPLGYGWHHRYDMGLTMDEVSGMVVLLNAEGKHIAFEPSSQPGQPVFDRTSGLTLYSPAPDDPAGMPWRIWHQSAEVWYIFAQLRSNGAYQPLHAVANTLGQRIELGYEGNRLTQVIDSGGRQLTLHYNEQGLISGLHGPHPDVADSQMLLATYRYNDTGDLISYVDANGVEWQHDYKHHLLVQTTTPTGMNFYWEYDGIDTEARCIHTWGDGGIHEGRFTYLDESTTLMEDSDGVTRYTYSDGLVTRKIDALGSEWQWQYNEYSELISETDPLGSTTRYGYDEGGNRLWVQYVDGSREQHQYDEWDRLTAYTNARENTWHYSYNERGLLASQTDPLGGTTTYTYDEQGHLLSLTNALGQITQTRYDAQHLVAHVITADNQIHSRTYDALGRLITLTDPTGAQQTYAYNEAGQLIRRSEPDGRQETFSYDRAGNLLEVNQGEQVVQFTYTGAGRLAERQQAGQRIAFTYDHEGRLIGLINEANDHYRFELDAVGRVVAELGFDGLLRRYDHDATGRVRKVFRPGGRSTEYTYTAMGQVASVVYSDGTQEVFGYDETGALIKAQNNTTTIRLERDALGRVIREEQGTHWVDYVYDALAQRIQVRSSLGADIQFKHNELGNVNYVKAGTWQATFGYDNRGLELQRQLSSSVQQIWQRDAKGRPIQQQIQIGRQIERQRSYGWTGNEGLARIDDNMVVSAQYSYDALGTLTGAQYSDGYKEVRVADEVGNLFETDDKSDRQYESGGRLVRSQKARYDYDEEGNLIRKVTTKGEQWEYMWASNGSLTQVRRPDGTEIHFAYDALGRRVSKSYKGKVTHWIWDGNKPIHEWQTWVLNGENTDDVITWLFEEASHTPLAKLCGDVQQSIVTDHLGTPLSMIDHNGQQTWSAETTAYGRLRLGTGEPADCPFRFQGQYEDVETGLYYNRFRYYDPVEGIYISQDPIRLESGKANLYAYVSDSTSWLDLFGLAELVYQLLNKAGDVIYYGITERTALERGQEHIKLGKTYHKMEVLAENLSHDQARTMEAELIRKRLRDRIDDYAATDYVEEKLKKSGLLNKNRGRDIDVSGRRYTGNIPKLGTPANVSGLKFPCGRIS